MKTTVGIWVLFVCCAVIFLGGCTAPSPIVSDPGSAVKATAWQTPGETITVRIKDNSFDPSFISIKAGTQVVWINEDTLAHRVTYSNKSAESFDSSSLEQGRSFAKTFNEPGRYEYGDSQHSYMKGTIVVV